MPGTGKDVTGDRGLGMGERICRRDFLNAAALATGGAFLSPLELRVLLDTVKRGNARAMLCARNCKHVAG